MNLNKKVAFYTLGCKVNQYETESIRNDFLAQGYEEAEFDAESDIYIVNSCTVTSVADKKTRNILRRAKKINPDSVLIVTGCYAETNSRELLEIEDVDFVVGNKNKSSISEFVEEIQNVRLDEIKNENIFTEKDYQEYKFAVLREMSRAYVKIQDGCNQFCSYCKIPFARGMSRSRKKENILIEINKLVDEGFEEIILIGINLGAYGDDFKNGENFESLLRDILKIEKLKRVRLGSVYPDKITDEFIEIFENEKMMPHLHISLQSCDDEVLRKMKRNYGSSLIRESLLKMKEKVENIEYTADVIVGFPGETDEMFENTYRLIEEIGFSNLHIFKYSDREGTTASKMTDKIDGTIKNSRASKLEALKEKMYEEIRKKYIFKDLSVLFEENKNGVLYGYSENYLRVAKEGSDSDLNKTRNVNIKILEKGVLIGNG